MYTTAEFDFFNLLKKHAVLIHVSTLRATADKASKLESTVEVYRKKLQDLNDFRRQVKSLQETNMMYMHNTVSLEDELKKANAARAQLETYKRQVRLHLHLRCCFFLRESSYLTKVTLIMFQWKKN